MRRIFAVLTTGLIATSALGITNGSFEEGFDGWSFNGGGGNYYNSDDVRVSYPFSVTTNPYFDGSWRNEPGGISGDHFARLHWFGYGTPGFPLIGPDGNTYYFDSDGNRVTVGLYQDITLISGQRIFGYARFGTTEAAPTFRDRSRILVNGESVWEMEVSDIWGRDEYISDFSDFAWESPWMTWEFTAPDDGVYRIQLELIGDDQLTSWGDFDGFEIANRLGGAAGGPANSVPEAGATIGLLALGLASLGLASRKCVH